MLRHILQLVYLCPCVGLSLFNFYPKDLFFILSLIFIVINHITSLNRRNCFLYIFQNISYYFWMITWMKKANNFQIPKVLLDCFAQLLLFVVAYFSLASLTKVIPIKKLVVFISGERNGILFCFDLLIYCLCFYEMFAGADVLFE